MDLTGTDEAGTPSRTISLTRRWCVALVVLPIPWTARISPAVPVVLLLVYLPVLLSLVYDDGESTAAKRRRPWWIAVVIGGITGLVVGSAADALVREMLRQQAWATATNCVAQTFGACGLGGLGLFFDGLFGLPIVAIVSGTVLAVCRVRRGFFIGPVGVAGSIMIAFLAQRVVSFYPEHLVPACTVLGVVGFGLAVVAFRPTVSPLVRTAAAAVPMAAWTLQLLVLEQL
jgi:hypothetical protein